MQQIPEKLLSSGGLMLDIMVVGKKCNPTFLLVMFAIVTILVAYFIGVRA